MKLLRKEIFQKSLFTISVFALGVVASGGVEKKTATVSSRSPASTLQHSRIVKYDSPSIVANSVTCDYSAKNHKVCENKVDIE